MNVEDIQKRHDNTKNMLRNWAQGQTLPIGQYVLEMLEDREYLLQQIDSLYKRVDIAENGWPSNY